MDPNYSSHAISSSKLFLSLRNCTVQSSFAKRLQMIFCFISMLIDFLDCFSITCFEAITLHPVKFCIFQWEFRHSNNTILCLPLAIILPPTLINDLLLTDSEVSGATNTFSNCGGSRFLAIASLTIFNVGFRHTFLMQQSPLGTVNSIKQKPIDE